MLNTKSQVFKIQTKPGPNPQAVRRPRAGRARATGAPAAVGFPPAPQPGGR